MSVSAAYKYEIMMKLMEKKKNEIFKKLLKLQDDEQDKEQDDEQDKEQGMTEYEEHKLDEVRGNFD